MKTKIDSVQFTALLGAITALAALSVDMSLPALPAMTSDLSAGKAAAQWTLSVFVLGFAGGQIFLGPLSDRVGRRPVLLCGLVAYVITGIVCALAPSIMVLVIMRFLQGLSACAGAVIARAIIRDVFDRQAAAAKQSILTVVTTLAMLIAPIVGAWLLGITGWRGVFALLPIAGAIILALAAMIIPETRPALVGQRAGALQSYLVVLREPITVGNAFAAAFIFAGLFVFIADSSTVFIRTLAITPQAYSLMFATVAFGQLCGSILNRMLALRISPARLIRSGVGLTVVATLLIGLFAMWPVNTNVFVLAITLYAFALGMTNPNAIAAAMVPLPQYAGSASAIIGFLYFVMASIGASLSGYLLPGTVKGMLALMAGFGSAGLLVFLALEMYHLRQINLAVSSSETADK